MRHTMVTYTVKPGREEENATLVRAVFRELAQARPVGFRYAVFRVPGSRQFVHLYTDEGATSDALQQLSSFKAFVDGAADRHEHPATFAEPELIGDYLTFANPGRPAPASAPLTTAAGPAAETRGSKNDAGVEP